MKTRILILVGLCVIVSGALFLYSQSQTAKAEINIYASPIQAGCYIAAQNDCRVHLDPFTINLTAGADLVFFQLITNSAGHPNQVIYDFRPDVSNPPPYGGSTYSPSLVAQDFAVTCGRAYTIYLIGQDTSNPSPFNLGSTEMITCPSSVP